MKHLGRVSIAKDEACTPCGLLALADAPRVNAVWPEIMAGRVQVIQDGEVGWARGTYRIALRVVDPSENESETVSLDVRRRRK